MAQGALNFDAVQSPMTPRDCDPVSCECAYKGHNGCWQVGCTFSCDAAFNSCRSSTGCRLAARRARIYAAGVRDVVRRDQTDLPGCTDEESQKQKSMCVQGEGGGYEGSSRRTGSIHNYLVRKITCCLRRARSAASGRSSM